MSRPLCCALICLCAAPPLAAAGKKAPPAAADPAQPPAGSAPPSQRKVDPELDAKTLYQEGQSEYDLGHYDTALRWFEAAYKKRNVAALLYNIAQCHRLLGQLADARATYRAFLQREPKSPYAATAQEKLREVEKALEASSAARESMPTTLAGALAPPDPLSPPAGAAKGAPAATPDLGPPKSAPAATKEKAEPPPLVAVTLPPPPRTDPGRTHDEPRTRVFTWVAGGAAVLAAGAGLYFGAVSRSKADEIRNSDHSSSELATLSNDVTSNAQKGNLLLGVGLGLAAISATCFVLRF